MTQLTQATPSQIEWAKAHAARQAKWGIQPQQVWSSAPPVFYDVCMPSKPDDRPKKTGKEILREVAKRHGLTIELMLSARRFKGFVAARQEAYYRVVTETSLSFPQIGRLMSKDPSTVLFGVRSYAKRNGLPTVYERTRPTHRRGTR